MAVVLANFTQTSNNSIIVNDYAIGLTLPLQMTTNTFNQTYDNLVQLQSNVKNLLLTQKGERLAQPTFGSDLHKLVFEPNDGELEEKISNAIESAISQWLPQLTVEKIDIDATADMKDKNQVDISIIFTAKYNQQNFSVKFKINE
jgi:phage baseplate assembly protein W